MSARRRRRLEVPLLGGVGVMMMRVVAHLSRRWKQLVAVACCFLCPPPAFHIDAAKRKIPTCSISNASRTSAASTLNTSRKATVAVMNYEFAVALQHAGLARHQIDHVALVVLIAAVAARATAP